MFITAMTPCPCGYFGDPIKPCIISSKLVTRYQKTVSGPLMDRIDIHIEDPHANSEELSDNRLGEPFEAIQQRVEAAREIQRQRFLESDLSCNADMHPQEIRYYCQLDDTCGSLIRSAKSQLQFTARAYHRVLKLARTIADLTGVESIPCNN